MPQSSQGFKWYWRISDGRQSLGDEKGPGRNGSAVTMLVKLLTGGLW